MWERIKGFIVYFIKNIVKLAVLFIALGMLFSLKPDTVLDEPFVGLFFLFFLIVNVTTVYDFGEFAIVATETGASLVVAFVLYFLTAALVVYLLEHAAIVAGIILLLFAANRAKEIYDFQYSLPTFFFITGIIVAITVVINAVFFFIGGPTAVPDFLYVVDLLIAAIEVINIIARATQADCDD